MTYRDAAAPREPVGRVVHGPFPVRIGRLVVGLFGLVMAPLLLFSALDDAHLSCSRKTDRCHYEGTGLSPERLAFSLRRLRGVRVATENSGKTRTGVPYLKLDDRELRLASTSVGQAQSFADDLDEALAHKPATFAIDLGADRVYLLPAALMGLLAISALLAALRDIGRVVLIAERGTLRMTRRIFGVPIWRGAVDLRGATDVEVAWEHRKSFWTQRGSLGDTYGRLVLVRGAEREPLTPTAFPGCHLHRRAEHALREVLTLPPRPPALEASLAANASAYAPAPWMGGGPGAATALAWFGSLGGAMVGIPLAYLILRPFGLGGDRSPSDAAFAIGVPLGAALGIATAFWLRRRAVTR